MYYINYEEGLDYATWDSRGNEADEHALSLNRIARRSGH